MRYIFLDTETGGLDPLKDALLTVGMVIHDDTQGILETFHIAMLPEGLQVGAEALKVNGINMEQHFAIAVPREHAALLITSCITRHFPGEKPIPVGHNIQFDLGFLRQLFNGTGTKLPYSYHSLDTMVNALFIKSLGLPCSERVNLETLIRAYNIDVPINEGLHNALTDARMTRLVFLAQREQMQTIIKRSRNLYYCIEGIVLGWVQKTFYHLMQHWLAKRILS